MKVLFASVNWADVQAVYPKMCEIECRIFLSKHTVCIEETMIEAGMQEIAALGSVL